MHAQKSIFLERKTFFLINPWPKNCVRSIYNKCKMHKYKEASDFS